MGARIVASMSLQKSTSMQALETSLRELVGDISNRVEAHVVPPEKQDRKTIVSLATYAAISDRAEGVLLTAGGFKPDPALAVLRSMQEGYLNLCYVLQPDGEERVLAMFYGGAKTDIERFEKLEQYIKEHPDCGINTQALNNGRAGIVELRKNMKKAELELLAMKSPEFQKAHFPDLRTRLERYDETSKKEGVETHLLLDYRLIYFYLSQHTHLSISALGGLIGDSNEGIVLNPNDPTGGCETVLHSAYACLADTAMLVLTQIGAPTDGLFAKMQKRA
jgi:hypothetical protein